MLKSFINEFLRDEEGQDLVEYSLLIALIALGALVGLRAIKTSISTLMNNVETTITSGT